MSMIRALLVSLLLATPSLAQEHKLFPPDFELDLDRVETQASDPIPPEAVTEQVRPGPPPRVVPAAWWSAEHGSDLGAATALVRWECILFGGGRWCRADTLVGESTAGFAMSVELRGRRTRDSASISVGVSATAPHDAVGDSLSLGAVVSVGVP